MSKTRKEILQRMEDWRFFAISLVALIILIIFLGTMSLIDIKKENELNSNVSIDNLNYYVNILNKNCGSSHITTVPNGRGYYVFARVCKFNDYCKYDYIKLEDCLN